MTRRPRSAAMEPARNGRDDPPVLRGRALRGRPQWSPPVMGGMTSRLIYPVYTVYRPQWSPPVMGGMTQKIPHTTPRSSSPQWSPPVMGGMTRPAPDPPRPRQGAAMEPARNGRDD